MDEKVSINWFNWFTRSEDGDGGDDNDYEWWICKTNQMKMKSQIDSMAKKKSKIRRNRELIIRFFNFIVACRVPSPFLCSSVGRWLSIQLKPTHRQSAIEFFVNCTQKSAQAMRTSESVDFGVYFSHFHFETILCCWHFGFIVCSAAHCLLIENWVAKECQNQRKTNERARKRQPKNFTVLRCYSTACDAINLP